MRYVFAAVAIIVSGCSPVDSGCRPVLGSRARGELGEGMGRPGRYPESILTPTPAKPQTRVECPITIVVETAEEAPAQGGEDQTEVMAAAVYGAKWCVACPLVMPAIEAAIARGYLVEYRDLDEHPTPHIKQLPAVIIYRDELPVFVAYGVDDVIKALEKFLP